MKLYAHFDSSEPAHTEVMQFESDISFELVRAMFVDAYNSKYASTNPLQAAGVVPTDQRGAFSYALTGSVFDTLNEGDDLFFDTEGGEPAPAVTNTAASTMTTADRIEEIKVLIKQATDDGRYEELAPLAQQIKEIERQQQTEMAAATTPALPISKPNVIQVSQEKGAHSHYYWDRHGGQSSRLPEPEHVKVATRPRVVEIEKIKTITSYAMLDEGGQWVKLYIKHAGVGTLPKGAVSCDYRERSFDLRIEEEQSGYCHRLHIPILSECIEPGKCKLVVKPAQVVLSLRKTGSGHGWQELNKIFGIGEVGKIEADYGETTRLCV